jgi:hypothetical protein
MSSSTTTRHRRPPRTSTLLQLTTPDHLRCPPQPSPSDKCRTSAEGDVVTAVCHRSLCHGGCWKHEQQCDPQSGRSHRLASGIKSPTMGTSNAAAQGASHPHRRSIRHRAMHARTLRQKVADAAGHHTELLRHEHCQIHPSPTKNRPPGRGSASLAPWAPTSLLHRGQRRSGRRNATPLPSSSPRAPAARLFGSSGARGGGGGGGDRRTRVPPESPTVGIVLISTSLSFRSTSTHR